MDRRHSLRWMRGFTLAAACLSSLFFLSGAALGAEKDYPSKPINIIVGNTPGAFMGLSAEMFAEVARRHLPKSQPVVVQYKPGAATAISADYVLKQPADGHTLLWMSMSLASKIAEDQGKLSFNKDDFAFIGTFVKTPTTHATEILGMLGFDFVVIDQEHAPIGRIRPTIDQGHSHREGGKAFQPVAHAVTDHHVAKGIQGFAIHGL